MAGNPVDFIPRPEVSAAKPPKNIENEEGCALFCFEQADGTEADDDAFDSEHSQPKLQVMEEPQMPMPQLDDCEWIFGLGAEAGLAGDAVSAALEHLKDSGALTSEITTINPSGVFLPESAFDTEKFLKDVESAFEKKLEDNMMFLEGVVSRKKQLLPAIDKNI